MKNIWKIVTALLAVAGAVALAVAFGDKIVAMCKKLCPCCKKKSCDCTCVEETPVEEAPVEPVEEAPVVEEAPAEEETPVVEEEAPVSETDAVADEKDFEG